MEMDLLKHIEYNNGRFPEGILDEIIKKREEYIPELLDILDYTYDNAEEVQEDYDYFAHIYASFLLAQFREPRAHSKIVKIVSLPGELPYNIYEDTITEDLPRLLASTYDGDDSLIKGLIENEEIDEYVKGSAIASLTILAVYKIKTRNEVIDYFKELFNGKLERENSSAWSSLINECCDLNAVELYDDIKKAFDDGLVDTISINMDDVDYSMDSNSAELDMENLKHDVHKTLITNTIDDLKNWAAFKEYAGNRNPELSSSNISLQSEKNIKIGRNDPCPCGSGLKYKKCCGR